MRFFLVLVSFGILLPARSGELEDILAKHYEALGGLENMAKAQSIEIHGTMVRGFRGNQMEAPIKIFVKNRKMVRIETAMRGRAMIRAYDGEKGWLISPRDGDTPMDMEKERAENFAAEADFLGDLYQWEENGRRLDYLGKEDVEGTEAYKIKVTAANGTVRTHYLDTEYFVPIKIVGTDSFRGRDIESHTFFSDYKQVGGLFFAHAVTVKSPEGETRMETHYERIVINPELEGSIFKKPDGT